MNNLTKKQILTILKANSYHDEIDDKIHYFYQCRALEYQLREYDFINYEVYKIPWQDIYLRGPEKKIAKNGYICCVGAAQTFGCYCKNFFPDLLEKRLCYPCLNLGIGGAGPKLFLKDYFLNIINNSSLCVLQVMSGRSVDNSFYENEGNVDYIDRKTGKPHFMNNAWLNVIDNHGPEVCIKLINESRKNWLLYYENLIESIKIPIILLYIDQHRYKSEKLSFSNKAKDVDDVDINVKEKLIRELGEFPQFIDQELVSRIPNVDCRVDFFEGRRENDILTNKKGRKTAAVDVYYPLQQTHFEIVSLLESHIKRLMFTQNQNSC